MNPALAALQPYPFERLAALFRDCEPPPALKLHRLSVGEPQHPPPPIAVEALRDNLDLLARSPVGAHVDIG